MRRAATVLGERLGAVDDAVERLAARGLVRRAGKGLDAVADLYHDGVRASLRAHEDAALLAEIHGRLADRFLAEAEAPHRIVRHLTGAGRTAEAAIHARAAAEHAAEQRAFGLAAEMYAVALAQAPHDLGLRRARASVLERAGRYSEAAEEWQIIEPSTAGGERDDVVLHRAHSLIAANRTREGLRLLDTLSGTTRVRGLHAVGTIARFALTPFAPAGLRRADPRRLVTADRNLKVGLMLAYLEPLTGMRFLQRARSDFARAGAQAQVAGCDYMFAVLALLASRDPERVPLADLYLGSAERRAAQATLPPDVEGMRPFVLGVRAMRRGAWPEALARFEEAEAIFREARGTTEHTLTRSWMLMMAAHRQDVPQMRARLDWLRRHARESGGALVASHIGQVGGYLQLLEGELDEGFETLTRAADLFDDEPPNAQRAASLVYRHWRGVYSEDPIEARRAALADYDRARSFRFLSTMYAGTYATMFAMLEANALRAGDSRASAARVEKYAKIADRSPPLWGGAEHRARAYAADALGRRDEAIALLARAEDVATKLDRKIDGEIARYQRGLRIKGESGARMRDRAREAVVALGGSPTLLDEDAGHRGLTES
ncbi:MAG: hypothetical protein IT378_06745 [Sandaracinaceae bacterium]|nr:hypothetical protein [Sandaracinaceae bacterium]